MRRSAEARHRACRGVGLVVLTIGLCAHADWNPRAYHEATAEDASSALTANDKSFFDALKSAIAAEDKAWLAAHMTFPLNASFQGKHSVTAAEFAAHFHDIVTLGVKDAIAEQDSADLFKNAQGICAGEGCVLWFGYAFASQKYKYRITTINTPVVTVPPPPATGCTQTAWGSRATSARWGVDRPSGCDALDDHSPGRGQLRRYRGQGPATSVRPPGRGRSGRNGSNRFHRGDLRG